jgi:hypothetical protein
MHIARVGQLRAPFAPAEGRGVETRDHEGRCLSMRVKEQVQRRGDNHLAHLGAGKRPMGVESAVTAAQNGGFRFENPGMSDLRS